jgi:hypothetical protein
VSLFSGLCPILEINISHDTSRAIMEIILGRDAGLSF